MNTSFGETEVSCLSMCANAKRGLPLTVNEPREHSFFLSATSGTLFCVKPKTTWLFNSLETESCHRYYSLIPGERSRNITGDGCRFVSQCHPKIGKVSSCQSITDKPGHTNNITRLVNLKTFYWIAIVRGFDESTFGDIAKDSIVPGGDEGRWPFQTSNSYSLRRLLLSQKSGDLGENND